MAAALFCLAACNDKQDWSALWDVTPSQSIDRARMDEHYAAHRDRWDATFEFLKNNDLDTLSLGKYQILGDDVFASVSEYLPKDAENCRFESHKKYIDLQYVISGEEKMGVVALGDLQEVEAYDACKDLAFYGTEVEGAKYEVADSSKYFVFFPSDVHRPSMKNSADSVMVKKVVVKILF